MRFVPIVIVAIAALLFAALLMQSKTTSASRVGQTVQNVEVRTQDGKPQNLLTGRRQVLNVFASWCTPCAAEMPLLADLKAKDVAIMGIAYKDKTEGIQAFLDEFGNPYDIVLMDEGKAAIALGLTGVPETFVIEADGKIGWHYAGALSATQLTELKQVLAQ